MMMVVMVMTTMQPFRELLPPTSCTSQIIPFLNPFLEFKIIGFQNVPFPGIHRTFQIIGFHNIISWNTLTLTGFLDITSLINAQCPNFLRPRKFQLISKFQMMFEIISHLKCPSPHIFPEIVSDFLIP